jgi:hypothetical protein
MLQRAGLLTLLATGTFVWIYQDHLKSFRQNYTSIVIDNPIWQLFRKREWLGLVRPDAEMSRLWMQYIAVTQVAGDTHRKPNDMLDQYVLVVKHSRRHLLNLKSGIKKPKIIYPPNRFR